jgi:hypothetical protein
VNSNSTEINKPDSIDDISTMAVELLTYTAHVFAPDKQWTAAPYDPLKIDYVILIPLM